MTDEQVAWRTSGKVMEIFTAIAVDLSEEYDLTDLCDAVQAATKAEYEGKLEMGVKWRVSDNGVYVEKRNQRDGTSRFVVIQQGEVLAKDGRWEWEPQPSSRTDAFVERTRFDSLNAAIDAVRTPLPETTNDR